MPRAWFFFRASGEAECVGVGCGGPGGWARVSRGEHGGHGGLSVAGNDRRQPSMSLGCPSVARRRSRRRLRNTGRQPSMGVVDVDLRCPAASHDGKPTPRTTRSAVSPSGATDGHPRGIGSSYKSLSVDRCRGQVISRTFVGGWTSETHVISTRPNPHFGR
jgi:hypothetical protein